MDDILYEIAQHICAGSQYKAFSLVSREFYAAAKRVWPDADTRFANHLTTLLKLYPQAPWNVYRLSSNPNITWEYAESHPMKWDYFAMSSNKNITPDIVAANPTRFNQAAILRNPHATPRERLTIGAAHNPNMTVDILLSMEVTDPTTISWRATWDDVLAHPGLRWNYSVLSIRIPFNIILANPGLSWDDYIVSSNPTVTWQDVCSNPQIQWNYRGLSANPNITWAIVKANPQYSWDYSVLAEHPNITWEDLQDPLLRIRKTASRNPNLTWKLIRDNPWLQRFGQISANTFHA